MSRRSRRLSRQETALATDALQPPSFRRSLSASASIQEAAASAPEYSFQYSLDSAATYPAPAATNPFYPSLDPPEESHVSHVAAPLYADGARGFTVPVAVPGAISVQSARGRLKQKWVTGECDTVASLCPPVILRSPQKPRRKSLFEVGSPALAASPASDSTRASVYSSCESESNFSLVSEAPTVISDAPLQRPLARLQAQEKVTPRTARKAMAPSPPSPLPTPPSTPDSRPTLPQLPQYPSLSHLPDPGPAQLLPSVPDTEPGLAGEEDDLFVTLERPGKKKKEKRQMMAL